jgi:DNA modification methylase
MTALPTQGQLLLPLLNVLHNAGTMSAKDACEAVAEQIRLPRDARAASATLSDGQRVNLFDRRVRWTRQNAVLAQLISPDERGVWKLTEDGAKTDLIAKPGIVITVYASPEGCLLWSEAKSALNYIEDGTVTSVITSAPYPLIRPRDYDKGMPEWGPSNYLNTLIDHIQAIRPKLTADGTFVLNLGPTFLPGQPCRNPYQHRLLTALTDRLGWHLVDEHVWVSPTKPRTSSHVTQSRTHCFNATEQVYLLSATGRTKCSNLRVLNPYTPRQRGLITGGGQVVHAATPSKIKTPGIRYQHDAGGAIPSNVHILTPDRDAGYRAFCAANRLEAHPAMMPIKLAEFFVSLTTEPDDLVADFFGGSCKVAEAALRLDRRFIISERRLDYLRGATSRFPNTHATCL